MMTLILICIGNEYSLTDHKNHNVNLRVHQIMYLFFFSLVTIVIVNILSIYNSRN